ncbi:MAG: hypothetical protein JST46_07435 [Bacteroidetes bacterium]|nr:hypothetical protein [Bacteroidota bacterium]
MKRKLAIALTCVYLLTATELNQIWKLPIFISHFLEHRTENSGITLVEFITLHYFSGDPRDSDFARDEQLPFRDNSHSLIGSIFTIVPASAGVSYSTVFLYNISFIPKTQDGKPSHSLTEIWQPPRA